MGVPADELRGGRASRRTGALEMLPGRGEAIGSGRHERVAQIAEFHPLASLRRQELAQKHGRAPAVLSRLLRVTRRRALRGRRKILRPLRRIVLENWGYMRRRRLQKNCPGGVDSAGLNPHAY